MLCDPFTNHENALSKHELGTGSWFIESADFISWTTNPNSTLWIHGIPGAGKTILSSTIIENIKALRATKPSHKYIYFYFDFHDHHKQTVTGLLRSLIAQLSVCQPQLPDPQTLQ
jgi:hypothetical protein